MISRPLTVDDGIKVVINVVEFDCLQVILEKRMFYNNNKIMLECSFQK